MTGRGIVALVVWAALLTLSLATGLRALYFLLFFLAVFLLFCALSVLLSIPSVRCDPRLTGLRIARKQPQTLTLRLEVKTLFPLLVRFHVTVPEGLSRLSAPNFSMVLKPGSGVREIPVGLSCEHRGFWQVGIGPVCLVDLFGLFSYKLPARKMTATRFDMTVCPRMFGMEGAEQALSSQADASRADDRPVDFGDSYAGIREFVPGDSMRRIHWVQTARTHELQTRQYDTNTERYGMMLVDTAVNPTGDDEHRLDYADFAGEVTAMMAHYYLSEGLTIRIALVGTTEDTVVASDVSAFAEIYDLMTFSKFGCEEGGCPVPASFTEEAAALRVLCIVTARPDEALKGLIDELAMRKCHVVCFTLDNPECREFAVAAEKLGAVVNCVADLGELMTLREGVPC